MTKSREKEKKIAGLILRELNGLGYAEAIKILADVDRILNTNTRIDIIKQLDEKYSEHLNSN